MTTMREVLKQMLEDAEEVHPTYSGDIAFDSYCDRLGQDLENLFQR